jgi:hypothetical protein
MPFQHRAKQSLTIAITWNTSLFVPMYLIKYTNIIIRKVRGLTILMMVLSSYFMLYYFSLHSFPFFSFVDSKPQAPTSEWKGWNVPAKTAAPKGMNALFLPIPFNLYSSYTHVCPSPHSTNVPTSTSTSPYLLHSPVPPFLFSLLSF